MTVRVPPAPLQSVLVSRRVELACRIVLNKSSCPPRHSGRCLSVRAGQERAAEVTGVGANIGAEKLKQQTLEPLRCAWEGCAKALDKKGSLFYNISGTTNAGDRDWSSLHGSTLCRACYVRFSRSGTLQQQRRSKHCGVEGPSKIKRGEEGVRLDANVDGHDVPDCGDGGIKDSDEDHMQADDMDLEHDTGPHDIRMLAPDDELPTLADAQRLHKSFLKLRPSMIVKDQEYMSTDSDSETGEALAEAGGGSQYLSQSQMPDIRNACESLMASTLLMPS